MGLTVAVTGPTGEIGISAVTALDRDPEVERIIGMARRPFDPAGQGWTKTEYRQGDITEREAVDRLVADADVVIHLAFIIMGSREESARVNLAGTRNVFEATVAGATPASAGLHVLGGGLRLSLRQPRSDHRGRTAARFAGALLLRTKGRLRGRTARHRRRVRPRGIRAAAVHRRRAQGARAGRRHAVEPTARTRQAGDADAAGVEAAVARSGIPMQLVHHDDVASAIALAATTSAPPGAYNLAGDGVVSISAVAKELGARPVRVPKVAATAASEVMARLPFLPSSLEWLHASRTSVVMDTTKAKTQLGWTPKYTGAETLSALGRSL